MGVGSEVEAVRALATANGVVAAMGVGGMGPAAVGEVSAEVKNEKAVCTAA